MDNDPSAAIATACAEIDITPPPPEKIRFDGSIFRWYCSINDKTGDCNAWGKACDNGDSYGGTVGHWRRGIKRNWSSRIHKELTQAERIEYAKRMTEAREKEQADRQQRHAEARTKAATIWRRSRPASPDHPYLLKKSVGVHGIRQHGGSLVIPLRKADGTLTGLQFVTLDSKKFLSGSEITGAYHAIGGKPVDSILIAEGYATAATLFESTGTPTACAFNAGNLAPVALAIREKFPSISIVICADADAVGIRSAEAAAAAVGGSVVIPDFGEVA